LPIRAVPVAHGEFDKLIDQGFAEEIRECPTSLVMRAQLVAKTKKDIRFCVNGSQQKKVMRVGVYPMPSIRSIFAFVAKFKFRAKVDLKWGYYNFEIAEEDRKWTITIGGGRAIQWRKLVQGFASSGAFFQYGMTKLLGRDIVGVIAEVYLDDLIIVGHTLKECNENVLRIMTRLNEANFRVNFAKCQFTPSTVIEFLGCKMVENVVHPGPKVEKMLSKIQPFICITRTKRAATICTSSSACARICCSTALALSKHFTRCTKRLPPSLSLTAHWKRIVSRNAMPCCLVWMSIICRQMTHRTSLKYRPMQVVVPALPRIRVVGASFWANVAMSSLPTSPKASNSSNSTAALSTSVRPNGMC
jgi:hypothetical protein